jgi:hypothetical protein
MSEVPDIFCSARGVLWPEARAMWGQSEGTAQVMGAFGASLDLGAGLEARNRGPICTVMEPRYGRLVITVQEATRPVASLAM